MLEEVESLSFKVGTNEMIKSLQGSSWNNKLPKNEVIDKLFSDHNVDPRHTLIVGDGRTEIKAGVKMDYITMSRLTESEKRQREIHTKLGTNLIIKNYLDSSLTKMIDRTV